MPKKIKYEGVVHSFPDDFTDDDIASALESYVPDRSVADRAKSNLADLKTENPFNRTKSLYAGAPDADRSPGLGDYLDEKLLSAEKAMVGSVPVGIAKAIMSLPAGAASSTGRSIGGETFSQDKSYAFPTRSDQDIALEQPVVRGLGPKKGMAPLLFAGGAYGEAPQTGAPADVARIGAADPFNLSDEAAFYRDWQRPPERIENYDQWLAQQDLKTRISPIKNGELNPHAAKNLLGSAVESAPQMAAILGASWLGGPGAGAVAGSALGAGNAGADTARYEAERGFSDPEAAMTAALGGIASGATEAIPIGDMLKRGGAAALKPGFWNAVRQAGVNTGKNALEEMPQELTQNYIEAMTAADPSRRMEYDISDPGSFAGRQLEIAAKAGLTSAGFSSITEAPNLYRGARSKPAEAAPPEKGVSAAVAPNPDRSARVVPVGTSVPPGMGSIPTDDGLLLYDRGVPGLSVAAARAVTAPETLDAFLAQHGTPSASGQSSATNTAQAVPPPLLVPPVAQTDAEVAELAKQIAARPAPPKALEPEEVAKKIERLVADPRTTPEEREILVAKYEQLTKVVRQRGQEAAVAKEMGPQDEPLDAGLPPPEADPYSDDFYLSEALQAAERSAGRTDRLGAPRPYNEQAGAAPFDAALLEDPPAEIPPAAVAERQRLEEAARAEQAVAQAETPPSPIEQLLSGVPPEVVAQAVEALAPVAAEAPAPKKEGLAERKNRERAEAKAAPKPKPVAKEAPVAQPVQQPVVAPEPKKTLGSETNEQYKARILAAKEARAAADAAKAKPVAAPVPAPIADPKAAEQHTPKQLKAAEQLVKLAYHSERTAEGSSQKYAAEREVERAERDARAMGVDVDAISRSVGREPTGSDGDARPTVAKVLPVEARETTPQVTIETSPFMQARRAAEAEAAKEAKPEPKKKADAPKTLRYEDGLRRFFRGTKLQSPIDAEGKLQWLSEHGQPSTDTGRRLRYEYHMSDGRVLSAEGAFRETNPKEYERLMAQYGDLRSAKARLGVYKGLPKDTREAMVRDVPWREIAETVKKFGSEASAITHWMKQNGHLLDDAWSRDEALSGRFVGIVNDITRADKHSSPSGREAAQAYNARNRGATDGVSGERPFVMYRRGDQWFKLPSRSEGLELAGWGLKMEVEKAPKAATPAKADTPKTVEVNKLAAAVAKEKALRAKRDADPENEALLDEYNDATAELYALTKEANGKGVSTLEVTKDDDTPSLMKTIPQREARVDAFGKKEPMSREAFSKALEAAKAKLPGIADLVDALDSQADLPSDVAAVANGDRIDGFTQNGRVVVVADGMTSPEHVAATLAHEAVGHLVPEQTFGKNEWRKRLDEMTASSTWFRDFVANFGKSEVGSRYKAAELASEAIAFEANRVLDDANYKPPNAYRMFIAKLREWLREAIGARRVIGLSKVLEFSDRDLAAFLARSKRTAETGLPKNRRKGDAKPSFAKATPGTAEPVATAYSEADYIDVPEIAGFDVVRRAMEDDMIALRRAEEAAAKKGTSRDEVSMYKASDERHGKAATEIQDVRSQFVTPIIKMAHKAGVTLDEIGDFLYARHALARNAEGRKRDPDNPEPYAGKSDEWAVETLTKLDSKGEALEEIANVVYAMLAYERKRIVEAGLATKEEVDGWRKTWGATYVPLQHQEMDEARSGNAKGYNVLKRAAKHATGRRTEADNPLYSAVSQVQRSITRAHNAEVGRQFDLFVQDNPNPEYWIRNPKPKTKTLKTKENEDGELETKVVTVAEPTFMRDDVLHVKDKDGNSVEIQILHPDVLRAMTRAMSGMGDGKVEKVLAKASAFTRVYGGLLTQYNLEFLLSNPIRDLQGGAANMAVGYGESVDKSGRKKSDMIKTMAKVVGGYGKSVKGIVQFMRDPNSKDEYAQLYAQMRREGATVGWAPFEDPKKVENQIKSDMNSLKRGALHPKEWLKKANEAIHTANTIAENGTRLSIYKMLGDKGITGRERVSIVKNATVNFNKRGEFGPVFNTGWIFGQVGVLGPAAMLKFAKRSPKRAAKMAAALTTLGWAQAMLLMAFSGDDDDDGYSNYSELQESEKSRNWILGKGKMPIGHSWSFFVNLGRHMAETQNGLREWRDLPGSTLVNMMDSFSPLGASGSPLQAAAPWFADPFVQMGENKTAFDAPIYPAPIPGAPTKPQSQTYFRSAPQWAKSAAEGMNALGGGDRLKSGKVLWDGDIDTSPETLQHLYDFGTQGAVKFATRTLAAIHNAASGQETRVSDIPVVRRFMTSEHPGIDRGRYIKQKQDLADKFAQAKGYKGLGERGEADKDLKKYDALLAGPLRSRTDFMKLDKLYAQLDDGPQDNPEIEALKKRVIAVAGRQYELSKKVDVYVPLDEGLLGDLEEKVETASPKKERSEAKEEIEEDLEGR